MRYWIKLITIILSLPLFISCGKLLDEAVLDEVKQEKTAKVVFRVERIEQVEFENTLTRAELSTLCTKMTIAVFKEGEKVVSKSKDISDSDFGTFALTLVPGEYQYVIIAHNGTGNCTISTPEKITFANNKCTDTFYCSSDISVDGGTNQSVTLSRAVAMFRLITADSIPETVKRVKFYYTGGSSTFDSVSGYGCVNSKQTEYFDISDQMYGSTATFEVYSFPHEAEDALNITVTALGTDDAELYVHEFSNVGIVKNKITQCTTKLFNSGGTDGVGFNANVENSGDWNGVITY